MTSAASLPADVEVLVDSDLENDDPGAGPGAAGSSAAAAAGDPSGRPRRTGRRRKPLSYADFVSLDSDGGSESQQFCEENCRKSTIVTRQAAKMSRTTGNARPSFFDSLPQYRLPKRHLNDRKTNSNDKKKLDTNMFESYLEDLWSRISEEKRSSYTYIDCLWFFLYKDKSQKAKVLSWIKKREIFTRKCVFVPIVCWHHWSLLVLCHFGDKKLSKTRKPCMFLLDSLQSAEPKRLEPDIRRFVLDIYESEGRKEKEGFISKIPLLIPKVPQQKNGEECGMFVLYFIYLFLQSDPENFTLEEYPYFLNEDWFKLEDLESFREEIHSFWMSKGITHPMTRATAFQPLH